MAIDPVWFAIEQLRRIVESLGWRMVSSKEEGDNVIVEFTKKKEEILKP